MLRIRTVATIAVIAVGGAIAHATIGASSTVSLNSASTVSDTRPDRSAGASRVADQLSGGAVNVASTTLVTGLNLPLYALQAPGDDERLYILEKPGVIRIFNLDTGTLNSQPFLNITSIVGGGTTFNTERGLLGMAFHPDFQVNGWFYVNYTNTSGHTIIRRYSLLDGDPDEADPNSWVHVIQINQPFANHNGGWIGFGPDGFLYAATGDGGSGGDPQKHGQNTQTLLGTMIRIDIDDIPEGETYGIPEDNPFVGKEGRDEIWAYGLRHPWRNSFDRMTGDLFTADVGQNQWEEVNFQPADSPGGENYGWRCYEGLMPFQNDPECPPDHELTFPFHVYPISSQSECAIVGGYVYRGSGVSSLDGAYIFGDFCSAEIWMLRYDGEEVTDFASIRSQLSPSAEGDNITWISSFAEDNNGELYIISHAGSIFKVITPVPFNDTCSNSLALSDGQNAFSNIGASTTGPEEPENCTFEGDSNIQSDVWYRYFATCTGTLTVSLCDGPQPPEGFDTKIAVYGSLCPTEPGEVLACNKDACGLLSEVSLPAEQGVLYRIRIGGHEGAQGEGIVTVTCEEGDPCPWDLTGDGQVDGADLGQLLASWGPCEDCDDCPPDFDGDCEVDGADLGQLLANWGACP